jgi:hypothetical protein
LGEKSPNLVTLVDSLQFPKKTAHRGQQLSSSQEQVPLGAAKKTVTLFSRKQ